MAPRAGEEEEEEIEYEENETKQHHQDTVLPKFKNVKSCHIFTLCLLLMK